MPGLANTLLGRTQKTFRLLTEETANKWRWPIGDPATAANAFKAGMIVTRAATTPYNAIVATTGSGIAVGKPAAVAMDNHESTLDECEGSGYVTIVQGPHVGQTKCFDTECAAAADGTLLYASNDVAGNFATAGVGVGVAIKIASRGDWLEYQWLGPDNA